MGPLVLENSALLSKPWHTHTLSETLIRFVASLVWNTTRRHRVGDRSMVINNLSAEYERQTFGKDFPLFHWGGRAHCTVGWCGCLMSDYFCSAWTPLAPISQRSVLQGPPISNVLMLTVYWMRQQAWGMGSRKVMENWLRGSLPDLHPSGKGAWEKEIMKAYSSNRWSLGRISYDG